MIELNTSRKRKAGTSDDEYVNSDIDKLIPPHWKRVDIAKLALRDLLGRFLTQDTVPIVTDYTVGPPCCDYTWHIKYDDLLARRDDGFPSVTIRKDNVEWQLVWRANTI